MVIIELNCGLDFVVICIIVIKDGEDYILNGEKIFVILGDCVDVIVVWVILDKKLGCLVIKFFVIFKGIVGMIVECLEYKLGIKVFDIVVICLIDCCVLVNNLLGNVEINIVKGFVGVMEIFDNICLFVVVMVLGCVKVLLECIKEIFSDCLDF